ncbi:MAG: glutamate--tRNA ligase family protein, partial [Pseudomonadota bacterium]
LSRSEIRDAIRKHTDTQQSWPYDPDGAPHYPGTERKLSNAEHREIMAGKSPFNLRLNMESAFQEQAGSLVWREWSDEGYVDVIAEPDAWGDVVLARKDTPASYHLCCVVDDALQGISHVVRGMDLYHSTSIHVLLQSVLDLPNPFYRHHKLVRDDTGDKLSKSAKARSIKSVRQSGISAEEVRSSLLGSDAEFHR